MFIDGLRTNYELILNVVTIFNCFFIFSSGWSLRGSPRGMWTWGWSEHSQVFQDLSKNILIFMKNINISFNHSCSFVFSNFISTWCRTLLGEVAHSGSHGNRALDLKLGSCEEMRWWGKRKLRGDNGALPLGGDSNTLLCWTCSTELTTGSLTASTKQDNCSELINM